MPSVLTPDAAKNSPKSSRRPNALAKRLRQKQRLCKQLQEQARRDRETIDRLHAHAQSLQKESNELSERMALLLAQDEPSPATCLLARERPMPCHQFGVHLIALAIELAKRVGFRATEFVLHQVFDAFGLNMKVPSHDAILQWTMRMGAAELKNTFNKQQRVLWMADHSAQIGKEQVLLIIGIALEDLPPPGQTLELEKMKVLAIVPGKSWKKEDVEREYQKLAEQIGAPVYLLCDGASELRDPAEKLEKDGQKTIVLSDLKHVAANLLEKLIGRSERFKEFLSLVGLTRNRTQQTEMGHFKPSTLRVKSRFMNLGELLTWAAMALHHLDHPESQSRQVVTIERMEEKFGWLRGFRAELAQWHQCQHVIDTSLHLINHEGLYAGISDRLRSVLGSWLKSPCDREQLAGKLSESLIEFVSSSEAKLVSGDRAWSSTEVLESLFGRYKQLEGQHSKSGFTGLIAAIPTLCCKVRGEQVRAAFAKFKSGDLKRWIQETIPTTLASQRNLAYREYRTASANT